MSFDEWVKNARLTAQGQVTVKNMEYDVFFKRHSSILIKKFRRDITKLFINNPTKRAERLIRELDADTFLCQSKDRPRKPHRCSRVMNAQDFVVYNIDFNELPLPRRGNITEEEILLIERLGLNGIVQKDSQMRTERQFAWVTPTDELNSLKLTAASSKNMPSIIRDFLGLQHYHEDEYLVEIQYPENITDIFAPTFLEGCPSTIFRSIQMPDGWGRAVRLDGFGIGLPEAIHKTITFTDEFKMVNIGRITTQIPAGTFDWQTFLSTFTH